MSIRDLFYGKRSLRVLPSASAHEIGNQVESAEYIEVHSTEKDRFVPIVSFDRPENFAKFGSAEEYYEQSIKRIYKTYPYDGSLKDKIEWHNSSSYLDNYIFENEYPRTNGYLTLGTTWDAASTANAELVAGSTTETYAVSKNPQYIYVKGGPNAPSLPLHTQGLTDKPDFKNPNHKANIYHEGVQREANFMIDGDRGNTVEFWFKAGSTQTTTDKYLGPSYAVSHFDLWNSASLDSSTYGRLLIETRQSGAYNTFTDNAVFHVTYMSGTSGAQRVPIASSSLLTDNPLYDWNHYAFALENNGSELEIRFYLNGVLEESVTTGSSISKVDSDPLNANIGAYIHAPDSASYAAGVGDSWGSVSGTYDEFRFWKSSRDSSKIKKYYFTPVGAGSNTDTANTDLGVYFKFNEGITGTGSVDEVTLDYSGRVSNGTISNYASTMRNTGSAIVSASAAETEFKDPIIYSFHNDVNDYYDLAKQKGREYDFKNPARLYDTIPEWIRTEDHEGGNKNILKITQTIASFLDTLQLQMEALPRLKDVRYVSGSKDKPLPFANRVLENAGFITPEIFGDLEVLEKLASRNEERTFDEKIYDIKNHIYQNIYNNLSFINKTKGTEKSIRNLIRCFGVDDELYKINHYANNSTYTLGDNYRYTTVRKTFADFTHPDRQGATVYQYTASSNTNAVSYVSASNSTSAGFDIGLGATYELEVILPNKPSPSQKGYANYQHSEISSSLFGAHSVASDQGIDPAADYAFATSDDGNFLVAIVRDKLVAPDSKDIYFKLTGTAGGHMPTLTSPLFKDAYDGSKWNLALRIKPTKYPFTNKVSGSSGGTWNVELYGVNMFQDTIQNEFSVSETIPSDAGLNFMASSKRLFVGAHRTNFSGSILHSADTKISSFRHWLIPLADDEIKAHARDTTNVGVSNPYQSAYLYQENPNIPSTLARIDTLALNWDFDTVTGSNNLGQFTVEDASSGSSDTAKYGPSLVYVLGKQHTGRGDHFQTLTTASVSREYVHTAKQALPETLSDASTIKILTNDDFYFTRDSRPVSTFFSVEKSMYQTISEEMIDMFASVTNLKPFENLIGEPVNRYRQSYKGLEKLRHLFFDKVQNTADLDRYLNYFKWFDDALTHMIEQLVPASSPYSGVKNIVESHVLERNKYWTKYPTIELKHKIPEGGLAGVNKNLYNWKFGHAPLPDTAATATWTFTDKTNETTTITLVDTKGTTVTFEVDNDGDGAAGTNTAMDPPTNNAAGMGTIMAQTVNASALEITATTNGSGQVTLTQDNKGEAGNTAITLSNYSNWNANTTATFPTNFAGGSNPQDTNCLWWKERAERSRGPLDSGPEGDLSAAEVSGIDDSRALIHTASIQMLDRSFTTPYRFTADRQHALEIHKTDLVTSQNRFGSAGAVTVRASDIVTEPGCDDDDELNNLGGLPTDVGFFAEIDGVYHKRILPFTIHSSSVTNTVEANNLKSGIVIADQHRDSYHVFRNNPLQGPFTEAHVGGSQHRHVTLNTAKDTDEETGRAQLRTPSALDKEHDRPEGWRLSFDTSGGENRLVVTSPDTEDTQIPNSIYYRDEVSKRPLNIKNIQHTTASQILGNYHNVYEVMHTVGRNVNNHYFIENSGIDMDTSLSTAVSGVYDFTLPDRSTDTNKTKMVIAERFSAPGDVSTLCRGFLDVESETYSIYNALPYRNLAVRMPLQSLLTRSCGQFGLDSTVDTSISDDNPVASYHKINKNSAKRFELASATADPMGPDSNYVTASVSDNWFIQHPIPQSDMQYAWITASATEGPFGYQQPDHAQAGMGSTDITFITASEQGSYRLSSLRYFSITNIESDSDKDSFIPTDFAGLNLNIYEPLSSGSNILGNPGNSFPKNNTEISTETEYLNKEHIYRLRGLGGHLGAAPALNALILHRNGPYGYPSWKQWRTAEHPIVRDMRKKNRISLALGTNATDPNGTIISTKVLQSYHEPAITSRYRPMKHDFSELEDVSSQTQTIEYNSVIFKHSYGNNLCTFSDPDLRNKIEEPVNSYSYLPVRAPELYNTFKTLYVDKKMDGGPDPFDIFNKMEYKELIYPAESNIYFNNVRSRENYTESKAQMSDHDKFGDQRTFWRDQLEDRVRTDKIARNSMGVVVDVDCTISGAADLSVWPLDAEQPFFELVFTGTAVANTVSDPAYPLNAISQSHANGELSYAHWIYNLYNVVFSAAAGQSSSITDLQGEQPDKKESGAAPTASLQYEYPNYVISSSTNSDNKIIHLYKHFIPKYRTNELAGRNPWYDSYEDYSADIRAMGKDYTIIPEFKISDHMTFYLEKGFTEKQNNFLNIPGGKLGTTGSVTGKGFPKMPFNEEFFKLYSHTDFMKHFGDIQKDYQKNEAARPTRISLQCNAIKKLLPYNGFYPVQRTVQLGSMLSQSFGPHISGSSVHRKVNEGTSSFGGGSHPESNTQERIASLMQPFFAPGILYNTIKSGVAVGWRTFKSKPDGGTIQNIGDTYGAVLGTYADPSKETFLLPFEALVEPKQYLPTVGSNLSFPSFVAKDINQMHFMYPHFSSSNELVADNPAVDRSFYFTWDGTSQPQYSLAMHNFLAETTNFFMKNKKHTTFTSAPAGQFKPMTVGTTYFMDVVLYKTKNMIMYEGPSGSFFNTIGSGSSLTSAGSRRVSARGMHYGPPFQVVTNTVTQGGEHDDLDSRYANFQDPSYAPYTPPYFYGRSVARVAFRPGDARVGLSEGESDSFTLDEILAHAQVLTEQSDHEDIQSSEFGLASTEDTLGYFNTNERTEAKLLRKEISGSHNDNYAAKKQMQITASVNLWQKALMKKVTYSTNVGPDGNYVPLSAEDTENPDALSVWAISTKFETPILDFSGNFSTSDIEQRSIHTTRGMWKGYSTPPSNREGVYLQVKESFGASEYEKKKTIIPGQFAGAIQLTGSLIDTCGFKADQKRVGELADFKVISEAVVAIPIRLQDNKFIKIDKQMFETQKSNLEQHGVAIKSGQYGTEGDILETSISTMIKKMGKYVLPPQFDFMRNDDIDPFVMYIFPFEHRLGKDDLANIWQGVMPDIAVTAEKASRKISHDLFSPFEFFAQYGDKKGIAGTKTGIPSDIRWMVFKVKQRAHNNYFATTLKADKGNAGFAFEQAGFEGSIEQNVPYSYNWPYDFFSLVELGQMESKIDFTNIESTPEDYKKKLIGEVGIPAPTGPGLDQYGQVEDQEVD